MIAAIVCPGQSMMVTWPTAAGHELVMAVNAAGKMMPHDWLCAGDKSWFRGLLGDSGRPALGILTSPDAIADAREWMPFGPILAWDAVPLIGEHARRGRPINWSIQSAMCHAAHLGAKTVRIYGADGARSTSTVDASGYAGEDRTADRWEREENDLAFTTALLGEHGVTVERIAP